MTRPSNPHHRIAPDRSRRIAAAAIVLAGLAIRLGVVDRQGLWADEFFSLAIATGHSLEHPADRADPALGDFVEATSASTPSSYARYLEHDSPPAGPGRVVRAVLLSDTSPPLYYLTLHAWTRAFGTSDRALRLFSVAAWLACIPPLVGLARGVQGRRAIVPACLLFSASPLSVHYATEGRMYASVWFLVLTTAWLTMGLHLGRPSAARWAAWALASACGMLTHYFFAFPLAGLCAWLFLRPGRSKRSGLVVALATTGLAIAPWYANLPGSLRAWRVTEGWLNARPGDYALGKALARTVWGYFNPNAGGASKVLMLAFLATLAFLAIRQGGVRRPSRRRGLLWCWLVASAAGPLAFDVWRGTYTAHYPRYAISGMPAAYLLAVVALGRLGARARLACLVPFVAACGLGIRHEWRETSRALSPFREAAALLAGDAGDGDLVIVHSIPSGVVGISRYLDERHRGSRSPPVAAWVGQLGLRRVPEDIEALTRGRRRVRLVEIHAVDEPAPEERWLRENATIAREVRLQGCRVVDFTPRSSEAFAGPPLEE